MPCSTVNPASTGSPRRFGASVIRTRQSALTAAQLDIWVAHARFPHLPQYNAHLSRRFDGPVDLGLLRAAVDDVLARNDAFRLRFAEQDGVPYQWTAEPPVAGVVDLSGAPDPGAACADWIAADLDRPLDPRERAVGAVLLVEGPRAVHVHVKVHHIVADATGLGQAFQQIEDGYAARATGAAAPPDPPSYLDAVADDVAYRASERHAEDRRQVAAELAGVRPALFARSAPSGSRGSARLSFTLPEDFLPAVARRGESPFAVIAAAFATYLSRVHRSDEVVLGVPLLNRRGTHLRTVGHFVNTLPLRVRVGLAATPGELTDQVRAASRELQRRERLPIGDVLRDRPDGERDLFDVTLSYVRWPPSQPVAGLRTASRGGTRAHDTDALAVVVNEFSGTGEVRVDLDHALDVFDDDYPATALARHLRTLIMHAVHRPDRPWRGLPMMADDERHDVVSGRNATTAAFPDTVTLHELFRRQAARTPDRVAVVPADGTGPLTFAQLDTASDRLAAALRADGVGTGDLVAVLLERAPHLLVAVMAVLKAGAAYVPIDPQNPAERVRFVLDDCAATVLLTSAGMPVPTGIGATVRHVDAPVHPADAPPPAATERDLAYVIYTSGSTGRPKGVMVEHRSVVNRLHWMQRRYPLGVGDVLLQKTPTSFDVSVWELFWWSITGARLALLAPGAERDPEAILDAVGRERVTVLHFVPSLFGPFLDAVADRGRPASLRRVFCSGEALPPAQVERFHELFDGTAELVNLYGPTEATVDVSYFDCPPGPLRRVPIGRPIDNIRLYVLDHEDLPQPVGVPGELHVSGVGVARGYLGRDGLTKEKFVPDPFVAGERMYRTGDLARLLPDGDIEYLGRVDEQVKVRGNRVEPGEVAARLAELPGVRDAVVVDRRSPERGVYLVGYYVSPDPLDAADIRAHLAVTLPDHMIPARFVRLDRIPLNASGKTDRRALPEADWAAGPGGGPAPRTAEESVLAEAWAEVMGVGEVGVHDDYYALGGDSILMLRVRAGVARRGFTVALADMVANPTIAALAPLLTPAAVDAPPDRLEAFALVTEADRVRLSGAEDAYPVTPMQLGVLFHSREHEGSAVYRDVFRYTFALEWDEAALRWAFDRLVRRHHVLRTAYDLAGFSEPLQVVQPTVEGALSVADLRGLPGDEAEAAVQEHIAQRRVHDYELHRAPLHHFRVFVHPSTVDIVFSFHHAILDGWSASTLIAQLCQDYLCGLGADVAPVPAGEAPSPAWYVLEERRAAADAEARQFWLDTLDGATLLQLDPYAPHEAPRPADVLVRWYDLPDGAEEQVQDLAARHGVPARSVYFAAHCLMLRVLSGSSDVTTGLFTHGRPEVAGAERTAGLFLNTMPVRLAGVQDSWLGEVRELVRLERAAYPYRRYPLSAVQDDRGGDTVLETAFNYVNLHVLDAVLDAPEIELLDLRAAEETNFALIVHTVVSPVDRRIRLRIDGSGRTFTPAQVDVLARTYLGILRRIAEAPTERPDFAFLPGPAWPVRTAEVPPPHAITRFTEQARRIPDAIAVASGDERWTYRRLAEEADRIARGLLALGADNTRCVGIAMNRSPEMIAAVLGVMRTGAATVPLDVSYPRERLALMIGVAEPLRVIVHPEHAGLIDEADLVVPIDAFGGRTGDDGPWPELSLEDVACILFTSGSTGRPKGVELPHRPIAHYLDWQLTAPSGAVGGKTLQFAPLSFDVSLQEIFATLSGGGTIQMITPEHRRDPAALARLMDREGVERIFAPYVGLQQLAEAARTLGIRPRALRVIVSSGEQLRVTDEIRWLCAQLPGTVLENQYGPTETHLVTKFTMTGDPAGWPALPPVGPPMDYLEVHLLDEAMRPVPEGVAGQVWVGGVGLAHGYRGQPEATAAAFVRHPWRPGERLYRVGDLARALPGGDLVYLGRADNQVKVRGFRVEPAEVEFAVLALAEDHPGIREVAVVGRRRDAGDAFLAAFLVGDPGSVDLDQVRTRLRATLPEHMVPSYFTWLPALPMTPSGKRDDAALRTAPLAAQTAAATTPPRDERERTLAGIVAGLLGLPEIGVHDDFFVAGGTSLTAMRLIVMIEKFFGVPLPLATFVSAPTVAELARRLRDGAVPRAFDPLVPIRAGGDRRPIHVVHPLGGNVLCYVRLARHLPADQPVYALQAAGSAPGTTPLSTMAELARSYLEAVRRVQPDGPYTLGGWSFGGFVAFEMARQLRAAGETVERLVVIDTISPQRERERPDPSAGSLLEWFYWELVWTDAGGGARVEPIPADLPTEEKFDLIADHAAAAGILPPAAARVTVRRLFEVYQANWAALVGYDPGRTDLDLTLLRAEEPLPPQLLPMHGRRTAHEDPRNGWDRFTTGTVDVVAVPGNHLTLMDEPNVRAVARAITEIVVTGEGAPT
jgi:amino acid adenylation domain-containing protein